MYNNSVIIIILVLVSSNNTASRNETTIQLKIHITQDDSQAKSRRRNPSRMKLALISRARTTTPAFTSRPWIMHIIYISHSRERRSRRMYPAPRGPEEITKGKNKISDEQESEEPRAQSSWFTLILHCRVSVECARAKGRRGPTGRRAGRQ